jgi:tetratricopeptide (TPR) repeat protein
MEDLELGLRFARMALDNGDVAEARRRYAELLADNSLAGLTSLRQDARYGYALAVEACGELDEAIAALNDLNDSEVETLPIERRIAVALALCRCHRERGDFASAVAVGERALGGTGRGGWTDELVELGATLLGAYMVRGDLLRSAHFAAELLAAAEVLGTPRATVASCWNAAALAEMTGRGEEAMALVERAMAIQSETGDPRNLTRLRNAYAYLMLRVRPSEAEKARDLLIRAHREHGDAATSTVDRARCALELAHAELVLGRTDKAIEHAEQARDHLTETAQGLGVEISLLLGQAYFLIHRDEDSAEELTRVNRHLEGVLQTRKTAETWLTLAEMQERLGDQQASTTAYQRALVCAGL